MFFDNDNATNNFSFFNVPFLHVTVSLIVGIFVGFFFTDISFSVTLNVCVVLIFIIFQKEFKKYNIGILLYIHCMFFSLGLVAVDFSTQYLFGNNINDTFLEGDILQGEITEASRSIDDKWQKCIFGSKGEVQGSAGHNSSGEILLYFEPGSEMAIGDNILLQTEILKIKNNNTIGEFDGEWYWRSKGISHMAFVSESNFTLISHEANFLQTSILAVRNYSISVINQFFEGEVREVAIALIIGDRGDLQQETSTSFSDSGIIHLLAVSGLHVGIIYAMFIFILRFAFSRWISRRKAIIAALILIWFYAFLTGFSSSVLRAVIMFSIIGLSSFLSGQQNKYNTLALSAFIILLFKPLLIFDVGFQLSYIAVLSIFIFYQKLYKFLESKYFVFNFLWAGISIGIAAQILTAPLSMYYFHQFPNYFILSNIAVLLLSSLVLICGVLLLILAKIPWISKLLAVIFTLGMTLIIQTSYYVQNLPGSVARGFSISIWMLIIFYGATFACFYYKKRTYKFVSFGILALFIFYAQFHRWQRMSTDEVYFPNSDFNCVLIKQKDKAVFLYQGNEYQEKKSKRIVSDYQKLFPCEVELIRMERQERLELNIRNKKWNLMTSKHILQIDYNNTTWRINKRIELFEMYQKQGGVKMEKLSGYEEYAI